MKLCSRLILGTVMNEHTHDLCFTNFKGTLNNCLHSNVI